MKKLACFIAIVSLAMLFGCSKDILTDENPELKKANVPIPFKGEVCKTNNDDVPLMHVDGTPYGPIPDLYVTGESWLSGNFTHMGKLSEESYMEAISAELDLSALMQEGKIIIVAVYEAHAFAANGDKIDCLSNIKMDVTDRDNWILSGDYTVTGGSGRFENASGSGILSGSSKCWDMEGTLEYPDNN